MIGSVAALMAQPLGVNMQQSGDHPQRKARQTKEPGKTVDPEVRAYIQKLCQADVIPSAPRIQQSIKRKFGDAVYLSENTIRAICRAVPRGEPWTIASATPLQARLVMPVLG